MKDRILRLIMDSFKDEFYNKAMSCIHALRKESIRVRLSLTVQNSIGILSRFKTIRYSLSVSVFRNIFSGGGRSHVQHIS